MTAPVPTKGKNVIFVKSGNANDDTGKSRQSCVTNRKLCYQNNDHECNDANDDDDYDDDVDDVD